MCPVRRCGRVRPGSCVAQAVARQGGGRIVLVVLGVGVVLYAGFSAVDAISHHDDVSPAAKRWGDRLLSGWGVVLYLAFAYYCFKTVASGNTGQSSAKTDAQHTQWSADVLRWPVGWFLLGAAIENDPEKGQGVDGAIRLFASSAPGPYLHWVRAAMLVTYAAYLFVEARYRRV